MNLSNQRGGVKLETEAYQHPQRPNVAYGNQGARTSYRPTRSDQRITSFMITDQSKQQKPKTINQSKFEQEKALRKTIDD